MFSSGKCHGFDVRQCYKEWFTTSVMKQFVMDPINKELDRHVKKRRLFNGEIIKAIKKRDRRMR